MERANLEWSSLTFAYMKTDGHIQYRFKDGKWDHGEIVKEDSINLSIAATCLHYGQECFEGIKVFEQEDGSISIFRVDENAKRMKKSAEKIFMAPVPDDLFKEAIFRVVKHNKRFIPPYGKGASLYVRPLLLGTSGLVGVKPASEFLFLVFVTPVGPYFKSGLKPIKLYVEEAMDRAAPDGVGDVKVGGNYAASLRVSKKARDLGYDEVLYLDARQKRYIDESGPANFFGITKDNKYITPDSQSILPSITNKSLMAIAEKELGITVEKRPVEIGEITNLIEAGCCGTAAVITPVKSITYRGNTITYSADDQVGETTQKLYNILTSIQLGTYADKFSWNTKIPV